MLDRLLSSIYSAVDKAPNKQVAIRVHHPDGAKWSISKRVLSIGTEKGVEIGSVALDSVTLGGLAAWLVANGVSIVYLNGDLVSRSASILLSGSGAESLSDGDAISSYDSMLWSLLDGYALELEGAKKDTDGAIDQLYINSADGEWLDLWGEYFGLPRRSGSDDTKYRKYLIDETLRPRSNGVAIEKAVLDLTGEKVQIYEPWKDMFVLGESKMDGTHHIADGTYYAFNIIQPTSIGGIRWDGVYDVVNRNKPAGVVVVAPQPLFPPQHIDAGVCPNPPKFSETRMYSGAATPAGDALLDYMDLSDELHISNHKASIYQLRPGINLEGMNEDISIPPPRNIAKASVCLSDGVALGTVNAVLGMGVSYYDISRDVLSGSATEYGLDLSDRVSVLMRFPVDEVIDTRHLFGVPYTFTPVLESGRVSVSVSSAERLKTESLGFVRLSSGEKNLMDVGSRLFQWAMAFDSGYELGTATSWGRWEATAVAGFTGTVTTKTAIGVFKTTRVNNTQSVIDATYFNVNSGETTNPIPYTIIDFFVENTIGDVVAPDIHPTVSDCWEQAYSFVCNRLPDSASWVGGWDSRSWNPGIGSFSITHISA